MSDLNRDDATKVYEIGYLVVSSVPKEKVDGIVDSLKNALTKKGAAIIGEEAPELIDLAYTMIKKIGTSNQRFDQGYFGWVKFELAAREIEEIKKSLDLNPDILRHLIITTVKENTYLGKRSPGAQTLVAEVPESPAEPAPEVAGTDQGADEKAAPASLEEMDKSIDEMVKGA
jgi:ribosomal protein S6